MSIWTHVSAVFRYDDMSYKSKLREDFDYEVGRVIPEVVNADNNYEMRANERAWEAYEEDHDAFVPVGSEGSLHKLVWVNDDRNSAARYTVTVFGDLRDYCSHNAVKSWFDKACSRGYLRQAVCLCEVEGIGSWTWEHGWHVEETPYDKYYGPF